MRHPAIPAPVHFGTGAGDFVLRSGARISYGTPELAPIVERFGSEVNGRTGLAMKPVASYPGPDDPSIVLQLADEDELGAVPGAVGVSPLGDVFPDERYSLTMTTDQVILRAAQPVGIARGLTTLVQLISTNAVTNAREVVLPGAQILDGPRYAWRGLSLDVARTFLPLEEARRVIDLLALYKLNVLHLHLTDDQGWRLPFGRTAATSETHGPFYSVRELDELVSYAAERFVTVVPEVDTPGHSGTLMRMHPDLVTGRNQVEVEWPRGHPREAAWLDPELPATFKLLQEVIAGVAEAFPSPYVHIGGDEPLGMPHDLYRSYVQRVRGVVRSAGKRPVGWQESARAGLGPDDVIQYWFDDVVLSSVLPPEFRAQMDDDLAQSRLDVETAVAASVPIIVSPLSHCYFDVPYAEQSADPGQTERQGRVGLRLYAPMTVAESFEWQPAEALGPEWAGRVGGVEGAIWAETISDFDDLTFMLLPRLPGVADKSWSGPQASNWAEHRERLAWHGRLWAQDELVYFRTSMVDWR